MFEVVISELIELSKFHSKIIYPHFRPKSTFQIVNALEYEKLHKILTNNQVTKLSVTTSHKCLGVAMGKL